MEIPMFWLVISGIFFAVGIIMNVVLAYAVFQLLKSVKEIQPQMIASMKSVEEMSKQVEALSAKVEETVDTVGGKAKIAVKAVDSLGLGSSKQVGIISTALSTAMSIFKLYQEIESFRKPKPVDKKPAKKE